MSLVLDSSVSLAWLFSDESTDAVQGVLDLVISSRAIVPSLWPLEVADSLQMAVRRRRITAKFRDASLADLAQLSIGVDSDTCLHAWATTLALAERFAPTVYDAAYLELAQRSNLPLATLDKDLRKAADKLGMRLPGI